jgi:flotillin
MEENTYLNQVMEQQAQVENELRQAAPRKPKRSLLGRGIVEFKRGTQALSEDSVDYEGSATPTGSAVHYRITGFWRWKTVVVPPNVYVVHTRRGHAEPLHAGLGISFRYDPATDAFLVIPAAVQTLLINAKCIAAERQGVLVQAYVQWVVDDLLTACRRLDFSDPEDPMRIVNVQLREQAEAAIKDKVATMTLDDILSDKSPIIEELTYRLRTVAEGTREGSGSSGLGLKIVTVQIKEAVVSSTRLWENLQKPFRADRARLARMAEIEAEEQIAQRELVIRQARQTAEIEATRRLDELKAAQQREAYDREQTEKRRRYQLEQETEKARRLAEEELAMQLHTLEAARLARELETVKRTLELEKTRAELERFRSATAIEKENQEHQARTAREERDVEVFHKRRAVENELTEMHVKSQLIARLPEVAQALPKPDEMRTVTVGGEGASSLTGVVTQMIQAVEAMANGRKPDPHD